MLLLIHPNTMELIANAMWSVVTAKAFSVRTYFWRLLPSVSEMREEH
jgi:hypothetical protein